MATDGAGSEPGAAGPSASAELRLRELTDQALLLLDQLAEARDQARHAEAERKEWHARCVALEARLADAAARVRRSASVRLARPSPEADPAACEVFLWLDGSVDDSARIRWFADLRGWLQDQPATLVVGGDDVPDEAALQALPKLTVLASPGPQPAALWNLALSAAKAPMVLLIGPGVVPDAKLTAGEVAKLGDPAVAVVQPALADGDQRWLGSVADEGLRVRRRPHPPSDDGLVDLELAAAEIFAVRRQAYDEIGAFDQDLGGRLALVDFCLRARDAGHRLVGAPRLLASVGPPHSEAEDRTTRDHLLLVARHRPQELAAALARTAGLWSRSSEAQRELIDGLLHHLRDGAFDADIAATMVMGIARDTVPWPTLENHLRRLGEALQVELLHAEGGAALPPAAALDAALERLDAVARENGELHGKLHAVNVAAAASQAERSHELEVQREHQRVLQEELTAAMRILHELRERLEQTQAEREKLAALRDAAEREKTLRTSVAAALAMPPEAGIDQLAAAVSRVCLELTERNSWVRALLREKATRRIKLRPKLLEHEARFLAEDDTQ